jgi:hypothetical protein
MNFTDTISLRGEFELIECSETGSKTLVKDNNLIVLTGRNALINILSNSSPAYIETVSFGSGGTNISSPNIPLPVLPTDEDVKIKIPNLIQGTDFLFQINPQLGTNSVTPKLSFTITVPKTGTLLNNKAVNTMCLTMNNGKAFAIKNFGTINKSDSISLIINWVIYI